MAYPPALSTQLETLTDGLVQSTDLVDKGTSLLNQLFFLLDSSKKFYINRYHPISGIGKTTATSVDNEIEFAFFLDRGIHPPYTEALEDFHNIMLNHQSSMVFTNIQVLPDRLKFDANNVACVLIPTISFLQRKHSPDKVKISKSQHTHGMEYLRSQPEKAHKYATAFCEEFKVFLDKQTSYTFDVIRLAKFWNKTVFLDEGILGRSYLIETIAFHAARKAMADKLKPPLFEGFRNFLMLMRSFPELDLKVFDNYTEGDVLQRVLLQRPLVLDPVNPYNNIAFIKPTEETPAFYEKLEEICAESLRRLVTSSDLVAMFEILPGQVVPGPHPMDWYVSIEDARQNTANFEWRLDKEVYEKRGYALRKLQRALLTTMASMTLRGLGTEIKLKDVRKNIHDALDENILGDRHVVIWTNGRQPAFEYTFTLPFFVDRTRCVQLSFNFP